MPIYEFECKACSEVSEHIMKISDKKPQICPHCEAEDTLSKLMSRTSFVLKGNGWYETDFKGGNKEKSSSAKKEKFPQASSPKKEVLPKVPAKSSHDSSSSSSSSSSKVS